MAGVRGLAGAAPAARGNHLRQGPCRQVAEALRCTRQRCCQRDPREGWHLECEEVVEFARGFIGRWRRPAHPRRSLGPRAPQPRARVGLGTDSTAPHRAMRGDERHVDLHFGEGFRAEERIKGSASFTLIPHYNTGFTMQPQSRPRCFQHPAASKQTEPHTAADGGKEGPSYWPQSRPESRLSLVFTPEQTCC
jgi:hypothetical protein